jgi:hypothetical protein
MNLIPARVLVARGAPDEYANARTLQPANHQVTSTVAECAWDFVRSCVLATSIRSGLSANRDSHRRRTSMLDNDLLDLDELARWRNTPRKISGKCHRR